MTCDCNCCHPSTQKMPKNFPEFATWLIQNHSQRWPFESTPKCFVWMETMKIAKCRTSLASRKTLRHLFSEKWNHQRLCTPCLMGSVHPQFNSHLADDVQRCWRELLLHVHLKKVKSKTHKETGENIMASNLVLIVAFICWCRFQRNWQ